MKTSPASALCGFIIWSSRRNWARFCATAAKALKASTFSLYSAEYDPRYGVVPREAMGKVLEICRRFADSFPNVNSNLLLQGDTGLGKTYLSACIARVVAQEGLLGML